MTGSYMILRNAFKLYVNRDKYAYFYGAKYELLTDKLMNELINIYWKEHFSRYSKEELEGIRNYSRGKIGMDCSAFITQISRLQGNSQMQYNATVNKTRVEDGKAGTLLYKTGHVGIDIGYGYCMHIPIEKHTLEIAKIQAIGFTNSGEIPDYDYSEANNR